jgi:hypothetical protein
MISNNEVMKEHIRSAIKMFNLNLQGFSVLTEAATGNYACTAAIAAYAGADVIALGSNSKYGTFEASKEETLSLALSLGVDDRIQVIDKSDFIKSNQIDVDIVTNTGFVRPINADFVAKLNSKCVIPLIFEPWEFRDEDLNLDECVKKGIKVYGTDESDSRLKTMSYIGYIVLYHLLNEKRSPFSVNRILLLANAKFGNPITEILNKNGYIVDFISEYDAPVELSHYDILITAEHQNDKLLIGEQGYLEPELFDSKMLVLHISGKVEVDQLQCKVIPKDPASFGYMSYSTDFIDSKAVVDLHAAGLKVAEGMLSANQLGLAGKKYKAHMEQHYPALAFNRKELW